MRGLFVAAALLVTACGSPRDERSVSAAPIPHPQHGGVLLARTLEASCTSLAAARCADFVLCASFADRARYADESSCVADVARSCVAHGNMPGVTGAIERADDCATALRALDCHDRRDPDAQHRACSTPGKPPLGALLDGSPCVAGEQCGGGACAHEEGKRCGVCVRAPAVGTPCTAAADCGGPELYCAADACAARRDVEGACANDAECRVGLSCLHGRCAIGTMREGEVCIVGSNACDPRDALRCIGEEWTRCVRYETLAIGDSCVDGAMGLPVICAGPTTYCRSSDFRCVVPTPLGGACTIDDDCGADHSCVQLDGRPICIPTAEVCR